MNETRAINNVIASTVVPHTAFEYAQSKVEQCFDYAQDAPEPVCLALVGESRTGKSRVMEECASRHPSVRGPEGLTIPILRAKTPSKPSVKNLAEELLKRLKDPKPEAGTEHSKTTRVHTLLQNTGVRMLVIDEFQHFCDRGTLRVMHHVADWLKVLVDEANVALVVVGLPTCLSVLHQNEQLAGRFLAPVQMPRFDWQNEELREEFLAIVGAFEESMGQYFDIPELTSDEMGFRMFVGTGGLIGYMTKFLRQAVWNALDQKKKSISLEDLSLAHTQSVWKKDEQALIQSPFCRTTTLVPTQDLLARVKLIGVPVEAPPASPKPRRVGRPPQNPQLVLTAS